MSIRLATRWGMRPELKRKLRASLRTIIRDPAAGKALHDELERLRSYRVGRLRIIYRWSLRSKLVELIAVGQRTRIYEETLRYVRRDQAPRDQHAPHIEDRKFQGQLT